MARIKTILLAVALAAAGAVAPPSLRGVKEAASGETASYFSTSTSSTTLTCRAVRKSSVRRRGGDDLSRTQAKGEFYNWFADSRRLLGPWRVLGAIVSACVRIKFYGAFVLNRRVDLQTIRTRYTG